MNDHERGFLAFLSEPTKRRLETLLELGVKRRRDVRDCYTIRCALTLGSLDTLPAARPSGPLEAMLRKLGAPATCYVLAANSGLDGREMPLGEALDAIIGMGDGAFVSCIPGRLGFYEYEDMKSSYLLSRC